MNALIFISRFPMPVASYECNSARTISPDGRRISAKPLRLRHRPRPWRLRKRPSSRMPEPVEDAARDRSNRLLDLITEAFPPVVFAEANSVDVKAGAVIV